MDLINKDDSQVTPRHELLCLANAASFNDTFFSEPLTTFAQGWRDPSNIEGELEFVAPMVEVPRRFEWRKFAEANDFMTESDDVREIGSDFKRVKFTGEIVNDKTYNRGLTMFIDLDEIAGQPNYRQRYTSYLLRRCARNDLRTAVTLLLASATNAAKTWNTESDPDADLLDLVSLSAGGLGFNPNRIYAGADAWAKRVKVFRAQDNAGARASAMMTPAELAAWLTIEEMRVSRIHYQSSATEKSKVVGSVAVAFYAESGQLPEDPSNIKRFMSRCADGSLRRVYVREVSEKIEAITVERYVKTVAVSTVGLRKYTIS